MPEKTTNKDSNGIENAISSKSQSDNQDGIRTSNASKEILITNESLTLEQPIQDKGSNHPESPPISAESQPEVSTIKDASPEGKTIGEASPNNKVDFEYVIEGFSYKPINFEYFFNTAWNQDETNEPINPSNLKDSKLQWLA